MDRRYLYSPLWVAIIVGCAQGTTYDASDLSSSDPVSNGVDAGTPPAAQVTPDAGEASSLPVTSDAGTDSAASVGATSSPGQDSGSDAEDSGVDSGTAITTVDAGTDSGGGSAAPTSCAQAYAAYGCCVGNELYYCAAGSTAMTTKACTGANVCGWEASKSYYDCVPSPGGADPGGTHSITCM